VDADAVSVVLVGDAARLEGEVRAAGIGTIAVVPADGAPEA
jgi:hypothetical protein